jgi:hypothetical protein
MEILESPEEAQRKNILRSLRPLMNMKEDIYYE